MMGTWPPPCPVRSAVTSPASTVSGCSLPSRTYAVHGSWAPTPPCTWTPVPVTGGASPGNGWSPSRGTRRRPPSPSSPRTGEPDVITFEGPGRLVELARERVDASILARAHQKVGDGRDAVTVVARRSPTRQGPITFSYLLDRGLSSEDPAVKEATARALAVVRSDLGLGSDD